MKLSQRPAGTLAADIGPFLRQIADRPKLVAKRRQQLEWWAARLGHLRRHAIAPADVRAALAEFRQTHAASTCNHYRQALCSLHRTLDGRDGPNPVRDVKPFTSPAPEARGLSYDVVQRILAAMSDQGSARAKGKPRASASAAKARCRVLAFTGLRPSELMRYRPEHWNRTTQTLVLYSGKGGRTRTIPLSAPAAEALAEPEAVGAIPARAGWGSTMSPGWYCVLPRSPRGRGGVVPVADARAAARFIPRPARAGWRGGGSSSLSSWSLHPRFCRIFCKLLKQSRLCAGRAAHEHRNWFDRNTEPGPPVGRAPCRTAVGCRAAHSLLTPAHSCG